MSKPNGSADPPADKNQKTETQQDMVETIKKLLWQKTELDVRATADSLDKKDVDLAAIMSDEHVQRELHSLERTVAGYIGICEDRLRQRIEYLVAPEMLAERRNITSEPLPESMIVDESFVDEAFGLGKYSTNAIDQKPQEFDLEKPIFTEEDIKSIQDPTNREGKALYFFYGTLMDPATLQHVTGLPSAPRMRPAHVLGYTTKLWGPFPVLLSGCKDDVVRGVACEIEGSGPKRRLEDYEGKDYEEWDLDLRLDKPDGTWEKASGVTFKWVGPRDELEEGTFSLSAWQDS
ncbi:hypothetical protein N8I77_005725 [Diaporthe amygdali]|uniref:Putative gamma-glutamylcyclotransferase n=1 Tax=Phomopsis amygdali TaxID=1214568 RepID=A0AAD9W321_PHOAM|nr:hypothetical protein N8I77_005725 [Diaporthe amygdali]